jgi:hypothetical protein
LFPIINALPCIGVDRCSAIKMEPFLARGHKLLTKVERRLVAQGNGVILQLPSFKFCPNRIGLKNVPSTDLDYVSHFFDS